LGIGDWGFGGWGFGGGPQRPNHKTQTQNPKNFFFLINKK